MFATEAIPVTSDMTPSTRIRTSKRNYENSVQIETLKQLADFFRPPSQHFEEFDSRGSLAGWNPRLVSYVRKYNVTVHTHIEDVLSESLADATEALISNYQTLNIGIINRIIYCRCMDYHNPKRNKSQSEQGFTESIDHSDYLKDDYEEGLTFWQAFEELSEADKSVLLLSYLFNLSVKEIVDEINELEKITTHGLIYAVLQPIVHKLRTIARKPSEESALEVDPQKLVTYKSVESRLSRARQHFWDLLVTYGLVQATNQTAPQEDGAESTPNPSENVIFSMNGSTLGETIAAGLQQILAANEGEKKTVAKQLKTKPHKKKKSPIETTFVPDTVDLRQYALE